MAAFPAMRRTAPRLALLLLFACGKGTISAKDFPDAYAKAVCKVEQTCRGDADFLEQQCEDGARALYLPDLPKALAKGASAFDARQAQACIDGLNARGCGRNPPDVGAACERAVTGSIHSGQQCNWIFECEQGRCAPTVAGACPSTCAGASGEGGPCQPACDLRLGLRCIDNLCSKLHNVDDKCSSDDDCALDLYCDGFGKCSVRAFLQASCEGNDQCAAGLFCDQGPEGGLCRTRFTQGQSCTAASADAIVFACADGLSCKGFSFAKTGATAGTCAATGEIGAGCVASAQITGCANGLRCQAGVCADKPTSGPCTSNDDCKNGVAYCDGTNCQLLLAAGATCASSDQCDSSFCEPSSGKCVDNDPACHEP